MITSSELVLTSYFSNVAAGSGVSVGVLAGMIGSVDAARQWVSRWKQIPTFNPRIGERIQFEAGRFDALLEWVRSFA